MVKKPAVGIHRWIGALSKNGDVAADFKRIGKRSTFAQLDTVIGPQHLIGIAHLHDITNVATWMLAGEARVVRGMPILGRDHIIEFRHTSVRHRDHFVASGDCQGTTGKKVILDIDKNQGFVFRFQSGTLPSNVAGTCGD